MVDIGNRTPGPARGRGNVRDAPEIERLVASLGDQDYLAHPATRHTLIAVHKQAMGPLIAALSSPKHHLRWEAAKVLGMMGDPAAASALVQAMEDEEFGVRWLAAEGLVRMGRAALPALLRALKTHADSLWLRESAHHVLRLLCDEGLGDLVAPVLAALDDTEPNLQVPIAAHRVLARMGEKDQDIA